MVYLLLTMEQMIMGLFHVAVPVKKLWWFNSISSYIYNNNDTFPKHAALHCEKSFHTDDLILHSGQIMEVSILFSTTAWPHLVYGLIF